MWVLSACSMRAKQRFSSSYLVANAKYFIGQAGDTPLSAHLIEITVAQPATNTSCEF